MTDSVFFVSWCVNINRVNIDNMVADHTAFTVRNGGIPTGGTFLCQTDNQGVLHCFDIKSINLMAPPSTTTEPTQIIPGTTTTPVTTTTPEVTQMVHWPGEQVSSGTHHPVTMQNTQYSNLKPGANGITPTDTAAVTAYVKDLQGLPASTTNSSTATTTILPAYTPSGPGVAITGVRIGWHPQKPPSQVTPKIDLIQFTAYHYNSSGVATPVLGLVTVKEPYNQQYRLNGELNLQTSKKHAVNHSFRGYMWRTECTVMTKTSPNASVSIAYDPAKYVNYVLVRAYTGGGADTGDWALYVTRADGNVDIYPFEGHASARGLHGRDEYYDFML